MPSAWTEGEVRTPDGATLHSYRRGKGPSLVLAHGSSDSAKCWSRVAAALEDSYDIVAYDAWSHGLSDTAAEGDPSAGADLVAVVEALGLGPTLAMGHSMGAATVSEAIAERPDLFRAAVLEDPGWMSEAKMAEVLEIARQAHEAAATMSSQEVVEQFGSPPSDPEDRVNWAEAKRQHRAPAWDGAVPRMLRAPWQDTVRQFRCPVLLVWGTRGLVTAETADEARGLFPTLKDAQLDTGHCVRYEAFEPYVAAVREFLAEAPPAVR